MDQCWGNTGGVKSYIEQLGGGEGASPVDQCWGNTVGVKSYIEQLGGGEGASPVDQCWGNTGGVKSYIEQLGGGEGASPIDQCCFRSFITTLERFSFDFETKTDEPNANRVSGVLIGSTNTRRVLIGSTNTGRTRVPSDWIWEHVRWTSCFELSGEQDSVHS